MTEITEGAHNRRVCFAIPIHPPHFKYARFMIEACVQKNIDIFYILSNDVDAAEFKALDFYCDTVQVIVIPDRKYGNPVVFKRIYALNHLQDAGYTYIIAPDAEAMPLDNGNFTHSGVLAACDIAFKQKRIFAGECHDFFHFRIWKSCVNIFPEKDQEVLSRDARLFSWFSDLPAWEVQTLKRFLPLVLDRYHTFDFYHCFDHMMYQMFLILTEGWTQFDVGFKIGLQIATALEPHECVHQAELRVGWVHHLIYSQHKEYFDKHGAVMTFHLDRKD